MSRAPRAGDDYRRRIDAVIDHLRSNLHRPVDLDELADVACFSKFHFHRVFTAVTGETVNRFANRARLEKSARLLRYSDRTATDIALDCGFSSSAAFSRAFRAGYGATPSGYRDGGKIEKLKVGKDLFDGRGFYLRMSEARKRSEFPVRLVEMPERRVAYRRVVNAFDGDRVLDAFRTMVAWARAEGLLSDGVLFGMSADDPHVTPKALYRYEVCLATSRPFTPPAGMSETVLPARRYAVARVSGDLRKVATAWDYLIRGWLINSPYEPEHAPGFEVFLDKERATDWSSFELDLCLPVRPIAATGSAARTRPGSLRRP